jgi:hypothetical protein
MRTLEDLPRATPERQLCPPQTDLHLECRLLAQIGHLRSMIRARVPGSEKSKDSVEQQASGIQKILCLP